MRRLIYFLLIALVILTIVAGVMFGDSGDFSPSGGSSSKGSSKGHTCYVCGDAGNMKYGSHYYCPTHWAMVKTVAEAD